MLKRTVIGMDISKRIFELACLDENKQVQRKRLYRSEVLLYFGQLKEACVVMECGAGAHYWGRELRKFGHEVKLIPPQFVKPFVRGNKNDRADALAILTAAEAPEIRFVRVKSIEQQELQHLHRVREQLYKERTARNNVIRGLLLEYGIVIPKGKVALRRIPELLSSHEGQMSTFGESLIRELWHELHALDERLTALDRQVNRIAAQHPVAKRLQTIPGVGPVISSAIVAAVTDAAEFKNGRQFSAWLGLVPRHSGTAGRNRNLGISKRGDVYLRKQIINGARSCLLRVHLKKDRTSIWATNLKLTRGWNRAVVALANKNARIIWALLRYEKDYTPACEALAA